jgi:hypothetical protein
MENFIVFRCPNTGMNVQTLFRIQEDGAYAIFETVNCLACTGLHFLNLKTGKLLGRDKEKR